MRLNLRDQGDRDLVREILGLVVMAVATLLMTVFVIGIITAIIVELVT